MAWFVILFLGLFLLVFPRLFSKIGWYHFDHLDGNEGTWEKDDKKNFVTKKVIYVYRAIGFVFIVLSLSILLGKA